MRCAVLASIRQVRSLVTRKAASRAATSGFARMDPAVVERVVRDVKRDLASGAWDAANGALRELESYDAGLRLVVATP